MSFWYENIESIFVFVAFVKNNSCGVTGIIKLHSKKKETKHQFWLPHLAGITSSCLFPHTCCVYLLLLCCFPAALNPESDWRFLSWYPYPMEFKYLRDHYNMTLRVIHVYSKIPQTVLCSLWTRSETFADIENRIKVICQGSLCSLPA